MRPLFTSLDEESASVARGSQEANLFVVADGVGGAAAGELASGKTVETLAEQISTAAGCFYMSGSDAEHEFIAKMEEAMQAAHERVRTELAMDGSRPASTATMLTMVWPRAYIFHVGDSRGYYLRGERLKQFTRDQTVGEFMVDAGLLTEEAAQKGGLNEVLTHAIGGDESTPSVGLLDFLGGRRPPDVLRWLDQARLGRGDQGGARQCHQCRGRLPRASRGGARRRRQRQHHHRRRADARRLIVLGQVSGARTPRGLRSSSVPPSPS